MNEPKEPVFTSGVVEVAAGVELFYEDYGNTNDPVILLVMGLGAQLTVWPDALVEQLLRGGFRVIRFDNRDVGLSTELNILEPLDALKSFVRSRLGLSVKAPYDLNDMAADVVSLMDQLKIEHAHLVGASMGGMIAQLFAAAYPHRVLSLTSIMSTTNERHLPTPDLTILLHLAGIKGVKVVDAASAISNRLTLWNMIRSPLFADEEDVVSYRAEQNFYRSYRPQGAARHSMAVMATGGFSEKLATIVAPTLVVHGRHDPLVPLAGGRDTAKSIPGANLHIIDGMGHDLPARLCPHIAQLITNHAVNAQQALVENL